jgi:CRP/FNR family transcriptional regulator, anaerobic regulatory protein
MEYHSDLLKIIQQSCMQDVANKTVELFNLIKFKKGETIFAIGKPNIYLGYLCKGILRSYIANKDGKESNIFFIMEKDVFSGNLMPGTKNSVNIQCITDVTCLMANFEEFQRLAFEYKDLYKWFTNHIDILHDKVKDRISGHYFDDAAQRYQNFIKDYPGLLNRIPHYHVANHLGITPTQLSRIRKTIIFD